MKKAKKAALDARRLRQLRPDIQDRYDQLSARDRQTVNAYIEVLWRKERGIPDNANLDTWRPQPLQ